MPRQRKGTPQVKAESAKGPGTPPVVVDSPAPKTAGRGRKRKTPPAAAAAPEPLPPTTESESVVADSSPVVADSSPVVADSSPADSSPVVADSSPVVADSSVKTPKSQEPAKKRARKTNKTKAPVPAVQPMETASEKKPIPREFVFMQEKEGKDGDLLWFDTKWHYTQKRPNDASQAGTKALRRYLKRNDLTKTETPIALRERYTNNLYFYIGELIPLAEPKEILRKGAEKPYFVNNKVTCAAPV